MRSLKLIGAFFLLTCVSAVAAHSQTVAPESSDQEKVAKEHRDKIVQMLEELVSTGTALKLPENRAIVFAMAGDIYWRYDQKRAGDLFRDVGRELTAYNLDFEKEQRANQQGGETYEPGDPRPEVLPIIARHDAALAMQVMLATRRPAVAEAMARAAQGDASAASSDPTGRMTMDRNRAATELFIEQQIALAAADQDPDAAVRLIKESLTKGVTYSVNEMLQKLYRLDAKKANDVAGDVVRKVLDTDFAKNRETFDMIMVFLQESMPPKPGADGQVRPVTGFKFSDDQLRDMSNKLADGVLQLPVSSNSISQLSRAITILDKLAPDRSATVKQRLQDVQKLSTNSGSGVGAMIGTSSGLVIGAGGSTQPSWTPNSTPEQIVAAFPKMANDAERARAAMFVGPRIASMPDEAAAKRLIDQIPDEKSRDTIQNQFEAFKTAKAISMGKLDDARRELTNIKDARQRLSQTVALALAYKRSGKDPDIESARSLMREAHALVADYPENGDDIINTATILRGYVVIEPDTAFQMVEPLVPIVDDFIKGSAVVSQYSQSGMGQMYGMKKGEIVMRTISTGNNQMLSRFMPEIRSLAAIDMDRTNLLVDRFTRADARTIVRLNVIQAAEAKLNGAKTTASAK